MIKIKKGLDLPIKAKESIGIEKIKVKKVAFIGPDFKRLKPSLLINEGDLVKLGQPILEDKNNPGIIYTAPATGKIISINRGLKRILQSIEIEVSANEENEKLEFDKYKTNELKKLTVKQIKENLVKSGSWTSFKTRPFGLVPKINSQPMAIFVTAIDTSPLAVNVANFLNYEENIKHFANGLEIISKLTNKVFVCKSPKTKLNFNKPNNVELSDFTGKHPAGLVGTHIHHLFPVNSEKMVWYIGFQDIIAIAKLFTTGFISNERLISFSGTENLVKNSVTLVTRVGANIKELVKNRINQQVKNQIRIISGNVLVGREAFDNYYYLGKFHQQISVVSDDDSRLFMGWLVPGFNRFSNLKVFASKLIPSSIKFNTQLNGEERPILPLEEFEEILPMDILVTPLLKALAVHDTDSAENLGVLELEEEDLSLINFICPGKNDYSPMLRKVLDDIFVNG